MGGLEPGGGGNPLGGVEGGGGVEKFLPTIKDDRGGHGAPLVLVLVMAIEQDTQESRDRLAVAASDSIFQIFFFFSQLKYNTLLVVGVGLLINWSSNSFLACCT